MKKRNMLISALMLLVLLAVAVFLFRQPTPQPQEEEQATPESLNPIEDEIPDVNPTANTNPFSDTYKNPFK